MFIIVSTTSILTIGAVGDLLKLDEPVVVSDVQGQVLVCTNFVALAAGEELALFRGTPAIAKAKEKSKMEKSRAWMQESLLLGGCAT